MKLPSFTGLLCCLLYCSAAGRPTEGEPSGEPVTVSAALPTPFVLKLVLPASVKSNSAIRCELRVENTGLLKWRVPAELSPCSGTVQIAWTGPDGESHTQCAVERPTPGQTITLAPGGFYGQHLELTNSKAPSVRKGTPPVYAWAPGRYAFISTVWVPGDSSRGTEAHFVTSDSVVVEVER
jgi:hypothetical protein